MFFLINCFNQIIIKLIVMIIILMFIFWWKNHHKKINDLIFIIMKVFYLD